MDEPGYVYVVRFWVAPTALKDVMDWLDGGHMQEVVAQPGFLWCRRLDLGERDEQGWQAYAMVYGLASTEAFDAYVADKELAARFAAQRAPFADALRIARFSGPVTARVDASGS